MNVFRLFYCVHTTIKEDVKILFGVQSNSVVHILRAISEDFYVYLGGIYMGDLVFPSADILVRQNFALLS